MDGWARYGATATGAVLVGVLQVVVAVSLGALVFSGPLADGLASGLAVSLAASAVFALVIGVRSRVPGNVGVVQDGTAVVIAVAAADVARRLPSETGTAGALPTVLVLLAGTSLVTGVVLYVLGQAGLGRAVRYLPAPVIGGFLAGTGIVLVLGGVHTMAGQSLELDRLPDLVRPEVLVTWVPGLVVGLLLLEVVRRTGRAWVIPAGLVALALAVHVVRVATGTSVEEAVRAGYLPAGLPDGSLWDRVGPVSFAGADLGALAAQAPGVIVVVLVATVCVLLNATALEASLGVDVDADDELKRAGAANLLAGAVGGPPGFSAVSLTMLGKRLGLTRAVPWAAAGACLLVLTSGGGLLRLLPLAVVGAVLVLLGAQFVLEELFTRRGSRSEQALVALIAAVIAWQGFVAGVAVGVIGATALFAAAYSRTGVVRVQSTGAALRSRVDRGPEDAALLERHGDEVLVLVLRGYLFFGSAHGLLVRVREWLATTSPARAVLQDLGAVTGLDGSAVTTLDRLRASCGAAGVTLLLCGAEGDVAEALAEVELQHAVDLDRGLEQVEDQLLTRTVGEREVRAPAGLARVGEERGVSAGDVLLAAGDGADELLYVLEGTLTAWTPDSSGPRRRIRTVSAGTFVGEIAFFGLGDRTATVAADGPGRVLVVDREAWDRLTSRERNAVQRMVLDVLALRLREVRREADALLGDVR